MRSRLRRILTDRSPNDVQRLARIYDAAAPGWDRREGRIERFALGRDWRRRLAAQASGDVLEIGIGTGPNLREIVVNPGDVLSYTGTDISTGMLAQARTQAEHAPFPVTLRQMNAESLAIFPDDYFDTVISSLVLCTVPDYQRALREMARVCRPNGKVILIEHVLSPNPLVKAVQKVAAPLQSRHMGCHLDRQTDRAAREAGYRIERDEARLMGVVHLIVARPPRR